MTASVGEVTTSQGKSTPPRIRVLWLIKGLGPGGAERLLHLAAQVAHHDRFAYEVAYARADASHFVVPLLETGVPVHLLEDPGPLPSWVGGLRQLLHRTTYDIVHVHTPSVAAALRVVLLTLPHAQRPAVVSTEHSIWSTYVPASRWANAALLWHDSAVLAVSDAVRFSVWRPLRARVEVVVHGVQPERLRPDPATRRTVRAELGVSDEQVLALSVANYRPEKGYPDLLEAARLATEADPLLRFAAVGAGPLRAEVHALHARLGLGGRFTLLDTRSDVDRLLAAADLFVLASHREGLPVSVMEALAAGLPVVATAVGGVPEMITPGTEGALVRAGHPEELAAAVVALAVDPDRRARMSRAASVRSAAYDIRTAVRRMEEIYVAAWRRRDSVSARGPASRRRARRSAHRG